ncbi:hypothetical protein HS088_TW22G01047 [Tripterygium wilfordii]|uniref:PAR1 protein n=1 Tax=Tripterygium wilfordii TaxID=458696 RepID=A0A7J7BZQ2_TRIWF|nr:uncharacterized protein LOC119992289 [Tripterygium wilfordii]KAF5727354.1 hypothetical protein HS088_TW22G01047 [Tripterygium wilfordii]
MALVVFLALSLIFHGALGELVCERLPEDLCSFAVSSSGNRCLLEKDTYSDGIVKHQCKTSEVLVEGIMREVVETDDCVNACGLDRYTVGISSDSLFDRHFTAKLCSPDCYQGCPNIVDLYSNLFLGEGANLPLACEKQRANTHRFMIELQTSNAAAPQQYYARNYLGPSAEPYLFDDIAPSAL